MKYERSYVAVVPSDFPDNRLAKVLGTLFCPFCGSQFEPIRYEACEETRKTERWERQKMVCASMTTKIPITLRCKDCGIEIHNLTLLGWFYGEQIKE